jgi:hypothetical protein
MNASLFAFKVGTPGAIQRVQNIFEKKNVASNRLCNGS